MQNDLISRSALLDKLSKYFFLHDGNDFMEVMRIVANYSTVDAVEVVRCGECDLSNDSGCAEGFCWCDKWNIGRFDNDYCSEGVRRADDGK